jgi:uncharacterized iron-regulated protein
MPRATARPKEQVSTAQAVIRMADALRAASFEEPLTMADLAKAISDLSNGEWEALQSSQRQWYWARAHQILVGLDCIGKAPIAEGERDGRVVYFLIDPP